MKRILEMEQARGCRDEVVIGGLDSLLRRFSLPAGGASLPDYSALDKAQREQWIKTMLQQLRDPPKNIGAPGAGSTGTAARKKAVLPETAAAKKPPVATRSPSLDASITIIKGVTSTLASKFSKLGVTRIRDLLYFFPRRHLDYSKKTLISQLEVGTEQTIIANVWEAREVKGAARRRSTEAVVGDESGNIRVIWFNQPYLARKLTSGSRIVISGKVDLFRGQRVFQSPEWELLESDDLAHSTSSGQVHTGRLVPVYPLTAGLSPRTVRRLVKGTVDYWVPRVSDFLPGEVRARAGLMPLSEAIAQAHYPDSEERKAQARRRLAFDELFIIQMGVLSKKRDWQEENAAIAFAADSKCVGPFLKSLPYALTGAQRRALGEIQGDLGKTKPMSRLLQGDVGSGKTVVATAAMLFAIESGFQAALMAPTEILAEQHFVNICGLLAKAGEATENEGPLRRYSSVSGRPISVGLLTGSFKESAKQDLQRSIVAGETSLVIGTHALIQKGVEFQRLGLCVVDEQHRFGVMQRSALRDKGANPHVLVMSATPIPRTLALTLYGDLDLSVIDELPPGRTEIKTKWLASEKRQSAYAFIRKEIAAGRQAFIVCPLVEESEAVQTKAALTEYEQLSRDIFPDLKLGLLHGRLSGIEKEEVMRRFRGVDYHILVSTPVVEVGVDVPNATVMLIEGADRFGLAQLHQFRGRVGRGRYPSYCILLADNPSEEARERLSLMERLQDGFALAEEDLRLRGPGEFFGTRQTGLPDLKMARLSDVEILELARAEALRLFQADPLLDQPEDKPLAREVARLWAGGGEVSCS